MRETGIKTEMIPAVHRLYPGYIECVEMTFIPGNGWQIVYDVMPVPWALKKAREAGAVKVQLKVRLENGECREPDYALDELKFKQPEPDAQKWSDTVTTPSAYMYTLFDSPEFWPEGSPGNNFLLDVALGVVDVQQLAIKQLVQMGRGLRGNQITAEAAAEQWGIELPK